MTQRVVEPPSGRRPPPGRPATRAGVPGSSSRQRAALIAGVSLVLLAVLAAVGNLVVVQGLVTDGDATKTSRDILAAEGTFNLGIAGLYAVVVLDVVVAWALMRVFRPVHEGLSRLAAWFRLAYSAVFLVAIAQLAGIPDLLSTRASATFSPEQVDAMALAKADAFDDIYMAGLLLFGAHLILLGYLTYVSGHMPRLLGVLLVVAGLGYGLDTMAAVLSTGSPVVVSTVTWPGEFLLAIWLIVRSRRLPADGSDRAVGAGT